MKDMTKEKRAFTEEEAAIYISMSRSFLRQDRMNGLRKKRIPGPKYIKKGRLIRYLREDLDEWLETNSFYSSNSFPEEPSSSPEEEAQEEPFAPVSEFTEKESVSPQQKVFHINSVQFRILK